MTNLINFELKTDLTESTNLLTSELIQDKRKIVKDIKFLLTPITSIINPVFYRYSKEASYKIKKIDKEFQKKYETIPEKNRVEPRVSIVGSCIEKLKFNLDENYIKEMFINILKNEMDNRKQEKIKPSYIQIVSELSKEDAMFIWTYSKVLNLVKEMYVLYLKNSNRYYLLYKNSTTNSIYYDQVSIISLENLKRLSILNFNEEVEYVINDEFKEYFDILNELSNNNIDACSLVPIHITHTGNEITELCCF